MIVLADYNLNRQAILISGSLVTGEWLDLAPIRLVTFEVVHLPADSNDRIVWRFAQANEMPLLTANRNAKGEDSLEQVMREEIMPDSLPIITIRKLMQLQPELLSPLRWALAIWRKQIKALMNERMYLLTHIEEHLLHGESRAALVVWMAARNESL